MNDRSSTPASFPHALPPRSVRVAAWASFVGNVVIILTGGLVRLTESGLGCTTWPTCTPDSLITTPEQGIHGLIEFGNRMMSPVLTIIAIAALVAVYRGARHRRDLVVFAWIQIGGVLVQAVVGGMTVLLHLSWNLVGFHYLLSAVLVGLMATFVYLTYQTGEPRTRAVPLPALILAHLTSFAMAVVVLMGVFATGSGPHSGSEDIARTGADATLVYHVHAWAAYVLVGLTVALLIVASLRASRRFVGWVSGLLGVEVAQTIVGIVQANTGLPVPLVAIHMVLAGLLVAATVVVVLETKRPEHS